MEYLCSNRDGRGFIVTWLFRQLNYLDFVIDRRMQKEGRPRCFQTLVLGGWSHYSSLCHQDRDGVSTDHGLPATRIVHGSLCV